MCLKQYMTFHDKFENSEPTIQENLRHLLWNDIRDTSCFTEKAIRLIDLKK